MIVIVDYGMGNLGSIVNMLKKLRVAARLSSDPNDVLGAERLILPGVGAFDRGMEQLEARGLTEALHQRYSDGAPILGVCLGMQLMTRASEEGVRPGLGWFDADVRRFDAGRASIKVPHMGWNDVHVQRPSPLFDTDTPARFYFVHSYHVVCDEPGDVVATTHHGYEFPSVIAHDNVIGVQFHPEKSHRFGMDLLRQFTDLTVGAT